MHSSIKYGFKNESLLTRSRKDGLNDILEEALYYTALDGRQFRAPKYSTTNGLSVPRLFWAIIPPTGFDWYSGVLHDAGYRNFLEIKIDNKWIKFQGTRKEIDHLLLEALYSQGASIILRSIVYMFVRLFGWHPYNKYHC